MRGEKRRSSWVLAAVPAASLAFAGACLARGDGTLLVPPRIPLPAQPVAIETGDWNRDGKLDLVALSGTVTFWVTLQDSRDRDYWSTPKAFRAGTTPYAAHSGDVNGDGVVDLLIADPSAGLFLLFSRGDGDFGPAARVAAAAAPRNVTLADFDGDGWLDIATANRESGNTRVLLGKGDAVFKQASTITFQGLPHSITTLDFDADGVADLVAGTNGDGFVSMRGLGAGKFKILASDPSGLSCYWFVSAADFNADGAEDLATACGIGVSLLNGKFRYDFKLTIGYGAVVSADFDGDGPLDIAYHDPNQAFDVNVHRGLGTGKFSTARKVRLALGNSNAFGGSNALAAADLDGDGRGDLVGPSALSNGLSVLWSAEPAPSIPLGRLSSDFAVADFDRDGLPDIVSVDNSGMGSIRFTPKSPAETLRVAPIRLQEGVDTIVALDLDADGSFDFLGTRSTTNRVRSVLLGPNGEVREENVAQVGPLPSRAEPAFLDGDASVDLLVPCLGGAELSVLMGMSGGRFADATPLKSVQSPRDVSTGDLDGDGLLDAMVVSKSDVAVHRGLTGGGLGPPQVLDTQPQGGHAAGKVVDLDGDGLRDIMVLDAVLGLLPFFNSGGGAFTPQGSVPVGKRPTAFAMADLDEDTWQDFIVPSLGSTELVVARGAAGRTFLTAAYRLDGTLSGSVRVADLNGDGALDVLALTGTKRDVVVLHGRTAREGTGRFRRGDVDDDGSMRLSDAIVLIGRLFLGGAQLLCEDSADANDDGVIDLSDPVVLLGSLILGQGPLPPPGGVSCGEDPTSDSLAPCMGGCAP